LVCYRGINTATGAHWIHERQISKYFKALTWLKELFTFEKTFADNLATHVIQDVHVFFFSRKEMKVFDENISAFFSI